MSPQDKMRISSNVPNEFTQIITGMLLGDASIRMNGKHALLSIQQKDKSFVEHLWNKCNSFGLVSSEVKMLTRKPDPRFDTITSVWYFQTLTLPYFTNI